MLFDILPHTMTDWFVDTIKSFVPGIQVPRIFVETGTYHGNNIASKIGVFDEIHSIDLKEEYVLQARKRFPLPNVHIHHGDSGTVFKDLVQNAAWNEPVVFFLDAHWSGGETAKGDKETPLLEEMEALAQRNNYDDVIFIDDTRFFGKRMYGGTPGDTIYPLTEFDWSDVTLQKLLEIYKRPVKVYQCNTFDRIMLYKA